MLAGRRRRNQGGPGTGSRRCLRPGLAGGLQEGAAGSSPPLPVPVAGAVALLAQLQRRRSGTVAAGVLVAEAAVHRGFRLSPLPLSCCLAGATARCWQRNRRAAATGARASRGAAPAEMGPPLRSLRRLCHRRCLCRRVDCWRRFRGAETGCRHRCRPRSPVLLRARSRQGQHPAAQPNQISSRNITALRHGKRTRDDHVA